MNYFSLFNLPETLTLDTHVLASSYQTLQKLTHPDKFATASAQEQRIAMQKNAQVNDGYSVLKHPLSRAQHLLSLRGLVIDHEQYTLGDPEFLMQQMEWRETLEEISSDEAALEEMQTEIQANIKDKLTGLASLFEDEQSNNEDIANEIRKLTFIYKFSAQIDAQLDKLDDF
jgi:molecular chaperone HscB